MSERHNQITRQAELAIDKHERLLQLKTMELLLGSMVRRIGCAATREVLIHYVDHLEEFS